MSNREEFEKAYTGAFIGEELKGLESIIFARFEIGGEYAQDKVATAYAMWQARVPEGYVVVPKEPTDKTIDVGMVEMTQETERLKTQLLAAEVEIARLQSALDDLKKTCNDALDLGVSDEFERGWGCAHRRVLCGIEAIIGTDK